MKDINRFGKQKRSGMQAENDLIENFFPSLGLSFQKIPESKEKNVSTPEGWILDNGKEIALTEIKLIQYQDKAKYKLPSGAIGMHQITIDKTIQRAISRAKKQLKSIKTNLPKILYLVIDDLFTDSRSVRDAAFGPQIEVIFTPDIGKNKTLYVGHRGFHPTKKMKQDNKILGDWVSAIFCYLHNTDGYKLLLFRPAKGKNLPIQLMPTEIIEEIWEYSEKTIVRKK